MSYEFGDDWFSHNIPLWESWLQHIRGVPGALFLEIGSWEGRSATWLLDNILTGEGAKITCVDNWQGSFELPEVNGVNVERRFDANVAPHGKRVEKLKGRSRDVLRKLSGLYDVIYIDGSHEPVDVLDDAILSWMLLKPNGRMIFDDYGYITVMGAGPKIAIDAFLSVHLATKDAVVVYHGHQVVIDKLVTDRP